MPDPSSASSPAIEPDSRVAGRYRLVRRLARGGMAEVWEAVDEVLDRPVAVKVLLHNLAADDAFVTRFRREAVAAAGLSDPHIVSIYDTCSDGGVEAIVMELVRGRTLRQVLDTGGALPPERAVAIAVQVARALEHSHGRGLVHRDIKPGNILLSDDGRVLVTDFGIAKAAEAASDLTEVGQVVGTAKYLAPEQVQGRPLDARSDLYALGVVLFEMLCGRAPFNGENSTATALARLTAPPPSPRELCPWLPADLDTVVRRCLARDPDERYATAADLRAALQAADVAARGGDADVVPDSRDATAATSMAAGLTAPPGGADDATPAAGLSRPTRPRRRWLAPALATTVVVATLAVVASLVAGTDLGRDLLDRAGGSRPAPGTDTAPKIGRLAAFDPRPGDGREHDDELPHLIDGDAATYWRTEEYYDGLRSLKAGVGVIVLLERPADISRIEIHTPNRGWSAEAYAVDGALPGELAGWGEPVARRAHVSGPAALEMGGRRATAALVWFTQVGEGPDSGALRVAELTLS